MIKNFKNMLKNKNSIKSSKIIVRLPMHNYLSKNEVNFVIKNIYKFFGLGKGKWVKKNEN